MTTDDKPERLHELGEVTADEGRAIASRDLTEAKITIGGVELSFAQAMTVRVALIAFGSSLHEGDLAGLGESLRAAYARRAREVEALILQSAARDGVREPEPEHRPLCKCGRVLSAPHRLGMCAVCAHEMP